MPCRSALLRVATALSLALALCVAASAQAQARVVRVGVYHNPPKIMAGEGHIDLQQATLPFDTPD